MAARTIGQLADEERGYLGNAQPRTWSSYGTPYALRVNKDGTKSEYTMQSLFGYFKSKSNDDETKLITCEGMGWNIGTAIIAELVATTIFVFALNLASAIGVNDGTLVGALTYAFVAGFTYLLLKTVLGEVTAIMDPTRVIVELFMPHVWRPIGFLNALVLNLAKLGAIVLGSIVGAAIVLALNIPDAGKPEYLGGISTGIAFFVEFFGAGLLMWVLLVTNYDRVSRWRNLTQGFVLIGLSTLFFPRTTAAFNFARWFGAAVVTGTFDSTGLVYFFAPLVGQAVFALVWFFVFRYPTKKLEKAKGGA